jgi:hypothetical protein
MDASKHLLERIAIITNPCISLRMTGKSERHSCKAVA